MSSRNRAQAQGGFTLIEVMLALTLFALLGTILYGAISLGHGAVEKVQINADKNQSLRSTVDLLGTYLRSSYPYRKSAQDQSVVFTGEETEVNFVSAVSLTMGGRGLAKIRVSWDGQADGAGALTLEEQVPARADEDAGGYSNSIVLADKVSHLQVTYLDPQIDGDGWVERWDGGEKKSLPRAVRFKFRGRGDREVEWVFPIMMTVLAP